MSIKGTPQDEPAGAARFNVVSGKYDDIRPRYPAWMLDALAEHLDATGITDPFWLDVGAGTGIFARQLADILPATTKIVGVEPSAAMREQATERAADYAITYVDGTAERLPAVDASTAMVSAATAAHWFDRLAFYAEVRRILMPTGRLAIVEYVRDIAESPPARDLQTYLRREGDGDGYDRPDYEAEFAGFPGLRLLDIRKELEVFPLTRETYVKLAFSSSHIAACVARLGEEQVRTDLLALADSNAGADGIIPYGYRMQMFVAGRA